MHAKWINNHEFTIQIDSQAEILSAGYETDPATGQKYHVKWYPCSQCGALEKMPSNVVSFFCSQYCEEEYLNTHAPTRGEILGYSCAAGYHD